MKPARKSNRENAGVRSLPENYIWPENFGNRRKERQEFSQNSTEIRALSSILPEEKPREEKSDGLTEKTQGSRRSQVDLELRKLALEKEKKIQEIERKKHERQMRIIEMEAEIKAAELISRSKTTLTHLERSECSESRYTSKSRNSKVNIPLNNNCSNFRRINDWVDAAITENIKLKDHNIIFSDFQDEGDNTCQNTLSGAPGRHHYEKEAVDAHVYRSQFQNQETREMLKEGTGGQTAINTETTPTSNSTTNSTTSHLTGNPQIDYIWDPNLPQELKGYNLSEYPFYERVPETIEKEITFKCDGLHDGFYASVPHKCQVYHHCLFGTRYDFLCANYTAFDQKTFICQFVSLVDCVNSKNFWHRNDALYEAASTTTTASSLKANIYTTAPPDGGDPARRPAGVARRPYRPRRRRPEVEYYDERPRSTRGRKKQRPKPVYDEEDEEYEDERYESRGGSGRRRPYRKRTNKDRRRPEYDDEEVEDQFKDEDFVAANKREKNEDKRKTPDHTEERNVKRQNGKRRNPSDNHKQDDEYERKPPPKPLETGDVVILVDENAPRYQWKMGRIVKTYPELDKKVRVVDVKINNNVYRRPVTKVGRLEVNETDK